MRTAGRGRIVVFSSVAGVRVRRANYVYGSAKAGLDGFASGLADALHGTGVRLLIVRPGFVIGRMTEGMTPAPLSSTPAQVADATAPALAKGRRRVWMPWALRPLFFATRFVPQADVAQDAAMSRLIVVGIGADGMAGLSPASRAELAQGHSNLRLASDSSTCSTTRVTARARRSGRRRCCAALQRCA